MRERPLPPSHHDRRNTPLPALPRHTQRAEFPTNGLVHDDPEEISQKNIECILSENKILERTISEIRTKLNAINEETNHIARLDVKLENLERELRKIIQCYLKMNFEESKFIQLIKLIEDDAEQLCDHVCIIHALFSETKKEEWKPLLWKQTFKSFDQIDKRSEYLEWLDKCFPSQHDNDINCAYFNVCKSISRVILQNRYESIPETDRKVNIFQPIRSVQEKTQTNKTTPKASSNTTQKSRDCVENTNLESSTHSLRIHRDEDSLTNNSQLINNSRVIDKKISKASIVSNRLSVYEIEEMQQSRESGIPKRTSSLAMYMDEPLLAQIKDN